VYEDLQEIRLEFNGKIYQFRKSGHINSMRVIEVAGHEFLLCNKYPQREYIFNRLIEYKINKLETQANHNLMIRKKLQSEMVAA